MRTWLAAGLMGVAVSMTFGSTLAAAQGSDAHCRRYATVADNQQRENLQRRCGFSASEGGAGWGINYQAHYNWCRRVSVAISNQHESIRNNLLARCRTTGSNPFCVQYARTAVAQNNENVSRRCGFTGARWQSNYANHYNWCVRVNPSFANGERNARVAQLQQCRSQAGRNAFCDIYARSAVSQNNINITRRCGFTGARWQSNYANHYNWCIRVNRNFANGERNARALQLNQCRPQQAQRYKSRWDKISGPGGPWTTGWQFNHTAQFCGHGPPHCSACPGSQSPCGQYANGQVITITPYGVRGDCNTRWQVRCTSVPQ